MFIFIIKNNSVNNFFMLFWYYIVVEHHHMGLVLVYSLIATIRKASNSK